MATTATPKLSPSEERERIAHALGEHQLVGVTAAAGILGIKPPNFKRDAVPHLTALPVEGSANVYFRSEVEELAAKRNGR